MKQKGKRVLAVALSALLCLSTLPSVAFASNTPSAWAQNQVNEAISYGLVPQSIQGDYQSPITRLEFAELMVELVMDYYGEYSNPYTAMGVEPRVEHLKRTIMWFGWSLVCSLWTALGTISLAQTRH